MQFYIHILTNRLKRSYQKPVRFNLLYIFILLGTPLFAQANSNISNPVSVQYINKVNAITLFKELSKQTGYKFYYDNSLEKVLLENIRYTKTPLGTVLNDLNRSGFSFSVSNKSVAVNYTKPQVKNARKPQPGRIAGKIVDNKGEALPGANIRIRELNKAMQSSVDGTYQFNVPAGTYTLEVSYISFQTKSIADVIVKDDQLTSLDIVLNVANKALNEVIVKSSFRRESIAGLYAQQKNAASVTDGISAEQIARTPDNNVGAVLKRISGVTILDNKYVVVRGLTERYNQSLIDGLTLPNTDLNRRNFSFDIVPTELVSSVVVNKTATPDMPAEFVGGQVMVNTLAIPNNNYLSISLGAGYNDRTTGKDFLSAGGRDKSDYLGFDDGRRKRPDNLVSWSMASGQDDPRIEATDANGFKTGYAGAIEQSKRFNSDGFKRYKYTATPNQNYRFTLGRLYELNQAKGIKAGFIAGLTYRNTQQANAFTSARELGMGKDFYNDPSDTATRGTAYIFNTTLGGVLNAGLQSRRFKVNIKNLYTRIFNEEFYTSKGLNNNNQMTNNNFIDPVFTTLSQHKIEGEHSMGQKGFKLDWSGGFTNLNQQHVDTRKFSYFLLDKTFGTFYQRPNVTTLAAVAGNYVWDYRLWTAIKERDFNWALNLSYPFPFLKNRSLVKAGYTGWYKKRSQDIYFAKIYAKRDQHTFTDFYETLLSPQKVGYGLNQAYYYMDAENGGLFNADSKYHAAYLMLDQHFFTNKLRLVYGLRAENFNLANRQEKEIRRRQLLQEQNPDAIINQEVPILTGEKNWNFLPSVNAIFSLSEKTNIRAAYAKTMIRPDFRETATFAFPDPFLQASISGGNISSTKIQNIDLRFEYYPSPGEVFSISGFHKYLDRPVELVNLSPGASTLILTYQNQQSAKNTGIEMEFRKSLNVISPSLANFNIYGNAAYIWSEIKTISKIDNPEYDYANPDKEPAKIEVVQDFKRPLIGQSPYIINAGLAYQSSYAGATMSFNRSGYRSYIVSVDPKSTEFQRVRTLVDLQLSGKLLKQKAEIKFNVANLLNTRDEFYTNASSWEGDFSNGFTRIKGTDNYELEHGDRIRYGTEYGRTYSLIFTYSF
ncbi:TonB-dependent receptor [Arcticibacter eurypsychrophilus]|uniref:TonB-dependent receptor n=1 Tax=Arcticibacter eurypsychrophilus TaxID=1434752 RepID=UPI00084D1F6F|nr:TonB-dependent receptor [Arcticibacter eurypsychrophilus]